MKMQIKWMLAAILLCGTGVSAQAQYYDTKNELSISIGAGANSEIMSGFSDFTKIAIDALITATMTGGTYVGTITYDNESYTQPIAVSYYRHLSKLVAVGGYAAYNGYKRDMFATWQKTSDGSTSKDKIGEAKRNNISLMPSVKFHWVRTKYFGFYSKLGVGATISSEKQEGKDKDYTGTDVYFNWDVTPLGLDAGSPQFRAFVEVGIGEQGIACCGLRLKF